jgi:hypothetical protein
MGRQWRRPGNWRRQQLRRGEEECEPCDRQLSTQRWLETEREVASRQSFVKLDREQTA